MYGPEEIVLKEGEKGYHFFIVESGLVEVFKKGPDGKPMVLGRVGPGGIFGEMAIIDDSERMASVKAVQATTVKVFPRDYLDQRLVKADPVVKAILKVFVGHIRFLSDLQAKQGFQIPQQNITVDRPTGEG
jgi:CRP-like cAMP-binding protein